MILSLNVSALASSRSIENTNLREPLAGKTTSVIYDSYELDRGTMYLKENSEYRIVYIVYDVGYISYAISYKNNPGVSHTGYYYFNEQRQLGASGTLSDYSVEPDATETSIVELLLELEPENTVNFRSRATNRATVTTETAALEYASNYAPGWVTPVNSRLMGQSWEYPVTVKLYEHVNGYCTEESVVNYYVNDTLVSIASAIFKLNLTKVMNVVTNVFNGASDYIAQQNGTLAYFEIDNTRTKTARIDDQTWYWAGWDREYCVYSGDKATRVEQIYNLAHPDYNENISYFAQKAYYNYSNQY